jgi:hypothetical protein
MAARFSALRPPYPLYQQQRFWGDLPCAPVNIPPDLRPSQFNPSYSVYAGAYGRNLAGLGSMNIDSVNAEGIKDYPNELELLQVADDVVGNGVFDPNGSHGNVHPDQGVFQDHLSLPGYIDRDLFYAPSEVTDATTGRQVMYVPGGAVAIDQAQARAFNERLLWELPPGVNPWTPKTAPFQETIVPPGAAWPINGLGQEEAPQTGLGEAGLYLAAGVVGLVVGIFVATVQQKGR